MSPFFHLFLFTINLVFELGKVFIGTLFVTQMMGDLTQPHWDPFPNSKYFKLFKPDQNDKTGLEILLTAAHATSLTKEPCLTFVAVEQPSIFKPCKKLTASPLLLQHDVQTGLLKNIY